MELTVLGRYSPFPAIGGALSGYLVRHGSTSILIDAGNGVAARLQRHVMIEDLTAVVLSHLHEDHIADAHCLRFTQMDAMMNKRTERKLQLYAPAEPVANRRWIEGGDQWQDLHTYRPDRPLVLGDVAIAFTQTNHPVPCYAMRVTPAGEDQPALFYTADTGESAEVAGAARGASLLLVEASLTEAYSARRQLGHLTAVDAASIGRDSGAKRVLLTHLYPGIDLTVLLAEGRAILPQVELAEEGRTYEF